MGAEGVVEYPWYGFPPAPAPATAAPAPAPAPAAAAAALTCETVAKSVCKARAEDGSEMPLRNGLSALLPGAEGRSVVAV